MKIVGYWHFLCVGMDVPRPLVVILVSCKFLSFLDDDGPYVSLSLVEFSSLTQSTLGPKLFLPLISLNDC